MKIKRIVKDCKGVKDADHFITHRIRVEIVENDIIINTKYNIYNHFNFVFRQPSENTIIIDKTQDSVEFSVFYQTKNKDNINKSLEKEMVELLSDLIKTKLDKQQKKLKKIQAKTNKNSTLFKNINNIYRKEKLNRIIGETKETNTAEI